MKELFVMASGAWRAFWGDGGYEILSAGSLLLLFLLPKKRKEQKGLESGLLVLLFFFFCPVTAFVLKTCIGAEVYWRVLWLFPFFLLTAYAGTVLWQMGRREWQRFVLLAVLLAVFVFAGRNVYVGGAYEPTTNLQKVPEDVAQICGILAQQKEEDEVIRMAATSHVATYARVFDPSIEMPYGRDGKGCQNAADKKLYELLMSYEPDLEKEARYARKNGWKYLVHWSKDGTVTKTFASMGYVCLGQVGDYFIFRDLS